MAFEELKEKYEELMEDLDEKGFPQPRVIVPAIAIIVLLIIGTVAYQALSQQTVVRNVSVLVLDASGTPVSTATVTLSEGGRTIDSKATGADGTVLFEKAPENAVVTAQAPGYVEGKETIAGDTVRITLQSQEQPKATKVVFLVQDDAGQPVAGARVSFSADGSGVDAPSTNAIGLTQIELETLPSGGIATALKNGYTAPSPITLSSDELRNSAATPITIILRPTNLPLTETQYGQITATISSQAGEALDNIEVELVDTVTSATVAKDSSESGSVVFEKVEFGKKVFLQARDAQGNYENAASDEIAVNKKFITQTLSLKRKAAPHQDTLLLTVADPQANVLADAQIFVVGRDNRQAASAYSDENGKAEFALSSGSFYATAWKEGFLPGYAASVRNGDSARIVLQDEKIGNHAAMTIGVVENNAPSAGATVSLFVRAPSSNRDGSMLGVPPLVSGADGIVVASVPTKIDGAPYTLVARASKGSKSGEGSGSVSDGGSINATVVAPPARLQVNVLDKSTKRNVSGAIATAIFADKQASCITALNGSCSVAIESGQPFSLRVSAPGYLELAAPISALSPLQTRVAVAEIYSRASLESAKAEFLGFFDSFGNSVKEAENAQSYRARFRLDAPSSQLAGIYIRVGRTTGSREDFAKITGVNSNDANIVLFGESLAPTGCELPSNSTARVQDGVKWVEYVFDKGFSGSKEFELKVSLDGTAPAGGSVEINYRAYGVANGAPLLSPIDDEKLARLLQQNAFSAADFCGSRTRAASVPISQNVLACDASGVCTRIVFADVSTAQRGGNGFGVALGKQVDAQFAFISSSGIAGVDVSSKFFDVLSSEANSSTLEKESKVSFAADNVGIPVATNPKEKAQGSVRLLARKPAVKATIDFSINSLKLDDAPLKRTVFTRITGTNSFSSVSSSVNELTLNQEKRVVISLRDSLNKPVEDARVILAECSGQPLASNELGVVGDGTRGKGGNGEYSFRVKPVGLGTIGVRVENADFTAFDSCGNDDSPQILVSPGGFISAEPDFLEFSGTFSGPVTKTIVVRSTAPITSSVVATALCGSLPVDAPMLVLSKKSFTLREQQQVSVTLVSPAVADCAIVFTAAASPGVSTTIEVPVSINAPAPQASPTPPYPPLSSQANLVADENGFAQEFFSLTNFGQVSGCRFTPSGFNALPEESVLASCTNSFVSLQVNFDLGDDALCFTNAAKTGRLLISRTVNGFPAPDAIIGVSVKADPVLQASKPCGVTTTPTPGAATPTPLPATCPPVPTCAPGSNAQQSTDANSCTVVTCVAGAPHCTNGVKDSDEDGVDCGGASCMSCQPSGGSSTFASVPAVIALELDSLASDEAYYSLANIAGKITGCEVASLERTATSPVNFVRVDSAACANKLLHIIADYSSFPLPPGISKELRQSATLRISREGALTETRTITVTAERVPNIPDRAIRCGDGLCTNGIETGQTCAADCPAIASCSNRIKDGDEEGTDCGGSCPQCTATSYPDLQGSIPLTLNQEAFDVQSFSLKKIVESGCQISNCEVKSSYVDSQNPATQASNFVTINQALCSQGVAQLTASYATFPNLYQQYRAGGTLYLTCRDGSVRTVPFSVSAEKMASLPASAPSCSDGKQNQGEQGVDCGGQCAACSAPATCSDNLKNGNETGIDCGGNCPRQCVEDLYAPLPDSEVQLTLNEQAFAEAYFHAKALGGASVTCSPVAPGFDPNADATELISNFVRVDCSGNLVHITADYARFPVPPGLYQSLVQGGTFKVVATGATSGKTIRVIVSAGANGAASRPTTGLSSLPSSVSLVVASFQAAGQFGGGGFGGGLTTPNVRRFAINFKNAPTCNIEGFVGGGIAGQYGGYPGFGLPAGAGSQFALSPQSYWPGGVYQNTPQIIYPPGYPIECQVPQVLYAPWLCNACRSQFPDTDYAIPRQQQPSFPPTFGQLGGGYGLQGAYPPFAGAFGGYGNTYGGGLGGQFGSYGSGGSSAFNYNQGFNQFGGFNNAFGGNQFQQLGVPQGVGINVPASCLPPSVCGQPERCSLFYCQAQVFGGGYGIAQGGLQQQLQPAVDCSESELVVRADYFGTSPQSAFVQQNHIRVTEQLPNGKSATRTIPFTVLVLADDFQRSQNSQQVLYCSQGIRGARGQQEQLIRIRQANADEFGLPKEIVIPINALTGKGEFNYKVALTEPSGSTPAFLCDTSALPSQLDAVVNSKCGADGSIHIDVDRSNAQTAATQEVIAESTATFRIGVTGNARATVPVKLVLDEFRPAGIQLAFYSKVKNKFVATAAKPTDDEGEEVASVRNGEEIGGRISLSKPIKIPASGLRVPGVSGNIVAADSYLQLSGLKLSSKDLPQQGTLAVEAGYGEKHTLPVYSMKVPTELVLKLNEQGSASTTFYFVGKGSSAQAPVSCDFESQDGADSYVVKGSGVVAAKEEDLNAIVGRIAAIDEEEVGDYCNSEKISLAASVKLDAFGRASKKLALMTITIGDGEAGKWKSRSKQIPVYLFGPDALTPEEQAVKDREAGRFVVTAQAVEGHGQQVDSTIEKTEKAVPDKRMILFVGEPVKFSITFPQGDEPLKRSFAVSTTRGRTLPQDAGRIVASINAKIKAKTFSGGEVDQLFFSKLGIYTVTVSTKVSGQGFEKKASFVFEVVDVKDFSIAVRSTSFKQGETIVADVKWPDIDYPEAREVSIHKSDDTFVDTWIAEDDGTFRRDKNTPAYAPGKYYLRAKTKFFDTIEKTTRSADFDVVAAPKEAAKPRSSTVGTSDAQTPGGVTPGTGTPTPTPKADEANNKNKKTAPITNGAGKVEWEEGGNEVIFTFEKLPDKTVYTLPRYGDATLKTEGLEIPIRFTVRGMLGNSETIDASVSAASPKLATSTLDNNEYKVTYGKYLITATNKGEFNELACGFYSKEVLSINHNSQPIGSVFIISRKTTAINHQYYCSGAPLKDTENYFQASFQLLEFKLDCTQGKKDCKAEEKFGKIKIKVTVKKTETASQAKKDGDKSAATSGSTLTLEETGCSGKIILDWQLIKESQSYCYLDTKKNLWKATVTSINAPVFGSNKATISATFYSQLNIAGKTRYQRKYSDNKEFIQRQRQVFGDTSSITIAVDNISGLDRNLRILFVEG